MKNRQFAAISFLCPLDATKAPMRTDQMLQANKAIDAIVGIMASTFFLYSGLKEGYLNSCALTKRNYGVFLRESGKIICGEFLKHKLYFR